MIVGGGLIANAFKNKNFDTSLLVFASGVSNSKTLCIEDCVREMDLMKEYLSSNEDDKTFLYFSTYSIDNPFEKDSPYVIHKLSTENYIKNNSNNYLIIRTGNIVGKSKNNSTIFNYIFQKVRNSEQFELWTNAKRNFLDVDHLVMMVNELIKEGRCNEVIYLLNPVDVSVIELLGKIEKFLEKKAIYKPVDKESIVVGIDKTLSGKLFNQLGITDDHYLDNLISKYCIDEKV